MHPALENSPNPFPGNTTITFTLPESDHAVLEVFDQRGTLVDKLFDGIGSKGENRVIFHSKSTFSATGIFVLRLTTSNSVKTRKMVQIK
jgi:hypothetical protein